jgi:hypothetical protein
MKLTGILTAIVAAVVPCAAFADEAAESGPVPGVYPGDEPVPGAPAGTCPAEPTAPRCPTVELITISPPAEESIGERHRTRRRLCGSSNRSK